MEARPFVDVVRERDEARRRIVEPDEDRVDVEDRSDAFTDELDDGPELELFAQGLADVVDEGQLRVPLARLLDRARPAEGGPDVLPDIGQQLDVVLGILRCRIVGLDRDDAERPAFRDEGRADPVAIADDTDAFDLAGRHQLAVGRLVDMGWLSGAQDVGRRAARVPHAERFPDRRVGQVGVDRVDVVREVDGLPLVVVQRDVRVLGVHQLADDAVNRRVERRHVVGGTGRRGDPVQRGLDLFGALVLGLAGLELRDPGAEALGVVGHPSDHSHGERWRGRAILTRSSETGSSGAAVWIRRIAARRCPGYVRRRDRPRSLDFTNT